MSFSCVHVTCLKSEVGKLHRFLLTRFGGDRDTVAQTLQQHFGWSSSREVVQRLPMNVTLQQIPAALAKARSKTIWLGKGQLINQKTKKVMENKKWFIKYTFSQSFMTSDLEFRNFFFCFRPQRPQPSTFPFEAHQVYGVKDAKVVFVVNDDLRNFADWCQAVPTTRFDSMPFKWQF